MFGFTANSGWCSECQRHSSVCTCDPKTNIYVVRYKLVVDAGKYQTWCDGVLRCIAFDPFEAISKTTSWIRTARNLKLKDGDFVDDYVIPDGHRDITIKSTIIYAENVGEMLKQVPLPDIFEHED